MALMTIDLQELQPQMLKATSKKEWATHGDFATADGVVCLCPKCYAANRGSPRGVHSIICWQPTVSPEMEPGPGRWLFVGSSLADVTFVAGSSSVKLNGNCEAHFFVRNGKIEAA
jgi:hypothetical protein